MRQPPLLAGVGDGQRIDRCAAVVGELGAQQRLWVAPHAALRPESLTPEARYVLKINPGVARPRHILISPKGRTVFSGHMTVRDIHDLLASPKTAALADMLARGVHGVVLVMAEDSRLRQNRLGLLQRISAQAQGVADFSRLEGF
jgi:hypothetical protein